MSSGFLSPSSWHLWREGLATSLETFFAIAQFPQLASWSYFPDLQSVNHSTFFFFAGVFVTNFYVVISALELMSKNIFCGSVRIVYAIIYTLFLVCVFLWVCGSTLTTLSRGLV